MKVEQGHEGYQVADMEGLRGWVKASVYSDFVFSLIKLCDSIPSTQNN